MKKKLILFGVLLVLLLTGCTGNAKIIGDYNKFHKACIKGDYATAEKYSTDLCIDETKNIGISVCMNAHDGPQLLWESMGKENDIQVFEMDSPEVKVNGSTAYLSWIDIGENWYTVQLYKIDGTWKVNRFYFGLTEE